MAATDTTEGVGLLESTEPAEAAPVKGTVYVVQVLEEHEIDVGEGTGGDDPKPIYQVQELWRDIATVTVPPRAHRKRAIEEALKLPENEGLRPSGIEVRKFRALSAAAAEVIPAGVRTREELVVG